MNPAFRNWVGVIFIAVSIVIFLGGKIDISVFSSGEVEIKPAALLAAVHTVVADELRQEDCQINDSFRLGCVLDRVVRRVNRFAPLDESLRSEVLSVSLEIKQAGLSGPDAVTLTPDKRREVAEILDRSAERLAK